MLWVSFLVVVTIFIGIDLRASSVRGGARAMLVQAAWGYEGIKAGTGE